MNEITKSVIFPPNQRYPRSFFVVYRAKTYARLLELPDVEEMLQQTLDEEYNSNKLLTEISENLNMVALEEAE